ncbi:MAG: carboxypeptidase-like regulatory domain-containing protein [Vicinamibacterales bacterium]
MIRRGLTVIGIVTVSVLCVASVWAQAPARERSARARSGTARVRGRVFAADTSAPARFAQLRLTEPTRQVTRTAVADVDGRFDFAELPGGRYALVASKSGFVTLQFGQRRPFEPGTPIEVADGQTRDLEFALPRGSVIAGRITDETGDPVARAMVTAARYVYAEGGRRRLEPIDMQDTTDDLGQFRLYGLMPGEYVVSASIDTVPQGTPRTEREALVPDGFATTYYPGTPSPADASGVRVGLGQEVSASFSLMAAPPGRVSGTATDSRGRPAFRASVIVVSSIGDRDVVGNGDVRSDGSFSLTGVPPGDYLLLVRLVALAGGRTNEVGTLPFTMLSGTDTSGLSVRTAPGATLLGTVVFRGEASTPRTGLAVSPAGVDPELSLGTVLPDAHGRVDADGRFALGGLFGRVDVTLGGAAAARWTIMSVTLNGRDVTDRPSALSADDTNSMRIVVSDQVTSVAGTIADSRGIPFEGGVVVFLPEGLGDDRSPARYVRTVRSAQRGAFQTRGLPAGRYRVVALEALEQGREWDPEFQAWARVNGVSVRIEGGRETTLALQF